MVVFSITSGIAADVVLYLDNGRGALGDNVDIVLIGRGICGEPVVRLICRDFRG